jgi:hypothetical protein
MRWSGLLVLVTAAACASGRLCKTADDCPRGAACVQNFCTGGQDFGGGGGEQDLAGGGGGQDFGGGNPDLGGGGGGDVYCGQTDATECACGWQPASGYSLGASCGSGNVSSPFKCCAVAGWPSGGQNGFNLGCVCSQIFCEKTSSTVCQCGFAAPSAGDVPVSVCSAGPSGVCCISPSTLAPTCACFSGLSACPGSSDIPTSTCTPSSLQCSDVTVSACN